MSGSAEILGNAADVLTNFLNTYCVAPGPTMFIQVDPVACWMPSTKPYVLRVLSGPGIMDLQVFFCRQGLRLAELYSRFVRIMALRGMVLETPRDTKYLQYMFLVLCEPGDASKTIVVKVSDLLSENLIAGDKEAERKWFYWMARMTGPHALSIVTVHKMIKDMVADINGMYAKPVYTPKTHQPGTSTPKKPKKPKKISSTTKRAQELMDKAVTAAKNMSRPLSRSNGLDATLSVSPLMSRIKAEMLLEEFVPGLAEAVLADNWERIFAELYGDRC